MARNRVQAAVRKAAQRAAARGLAHDTLAAPPAEMSADGRARLVADGVRQTSAAIADLVRPGSLWWLGPLQFVAEQMSVRVVRQYEMPVARADDVAAYLMGALQEYVVALTGEFDVEHFEAWTAAAAEMEQRQQPIV